MATKAADVRGRREAVKAAKNAVQAVRNEPSREAEKAQMAKALGHPTRLKILTVAHQRAISPGEFAKEHGMKIGTVFHHFEKLVEYGALKLVNKEKASGSTRHMYVGMKRAIYTESAWSSLPESIQVGLATATLEELLRVMSRSIEAGKLTERDDLTFVWKEVRLDEIAWKALWEMLRLLWQRVSALEEESETRLAESSEKGFKAVVGLIALEAAEKHEMEAQQAKAEPPPSREAEKAQMAKALGHPTRLKILTVAHQRAISPGEFAKESGQKNSSVGYHFRKLVEYGALRLVKKEKAGGSTRHMYVGTKRAIYTESSWPTLPRSVQADIATATLDDLVRSIFRSIETGKFTYRNDFTFTWEEVVLDEAAWRTLRPMLQLLWKKVPTLVEESEARLEESGEKGLKTVVGLIAFEAAEPERPRQSRKKKQARK